MLIKERKIWTPDNSFLLEYHAKIETGEIVVGRELWMELERLKADFLNDAYFYDAEDALLRMDFMENCIRLTKSPYYGKPMILMLWQKAFIEATYSFKMSDTTFRRFQKVLFIIARKNTKSETCSALGLTEFFVGNAGSVICCSSNDDAQATINYGKMDTMRRMLDPDDLDSARNQSHIYNKVNNSEIIKISDRTKNKEGRDIDVVLLDESNMMKTNEIAMSMEQSQSLKDEPLFFNMTTEGMEIDGYLDSELAYARKIIAGELDEDLDAMTVLPWLYTQDSEQEVWQNRESWVKSNPTLIHGVKKWSYLDKQVARAKQDKATRIFVLCKDFNIKQNGAASWLNLEDYDYKAVFDLEEFRGCVCLGAVDLSETTDLTAAKVLFMRPDDPVKYIHTRYFIPESKLTDSDDRHAGAKYKEWTEAGLITVTEGNDIDLSQVADWFYSLHTDYNIKLWKCGYDQKFAKDWINRMDFYGWTKQNDELVMILQNAQTLSNAMKLLEADFQHQLVNYNENPVDKWCLSNAGIKVDDLGRCLCIKLEPSKRIDGAVCDIILYEMYRQNRTEFKQMIGGK